LPGSGDVMVSPDCVGFDASDFVGLDESPVWMKSVGCAVGEKSIGAGAVMFVADAGVAHSFDVLPMYQDLLR